MHKLIISDTDFLSSFAKIKKIELIFKVFRTNSLSITQAVYEELKQCPVFEELLPYFADKRIENKKTSDNSVPTHFGKGEKESISLAKETKSKLLMDDRKAAKYAESIGVIVIDTPAFLFYCKEKKILSVAEIKKIITQLREKDYYEFNEEVKKELISE